MNRKNTPQRKALSKMVDVGEFNKTTYKYFNKSMLLNSNLTNLIPNDDPLVVDTNKQ